MSDNWDFYQCLVDGAPASIFVDLGIAREAPRTTHGHLAYVRLQMRSPRLDGLSSAEEFQDLGALEDAMVPYLMKAANSIFVGRNTSNGNRDFYFFAADGEQFQKAAQDVFLRFPDYKMETGSRPDAAWSAYFNFLFPPERELQMIGNRRVCENLKKHGDALVDARNIDHRVYLPTEEAAKRFSHALGAENFSLINSERNEDGRWFVDFQRVDKQSEIDVIVSGLLEQCSELGGSYDGWGCTVIK
jgi:uncharacterized protein (TIGR01619 family)